MTEKTRQLAVKRLLRVKKQILKTPETISMEDWINGEAYNKNGENCGTTACIGGHLVLNEGYIADGWAVCRKPRSNKRLATMNLTAKLLGFNEADLIGSLVLTGEWPSGLGARYENARTVATRAKLAALAIDAFIRDHLTKDKVQEKPRRHHE